MESNASATFTETGSHSAIFAGFRGKVIRISKKHPVFSTSFSPTLVWTILMFTGSKRDSEQIIYSHQPSALVLTALILHCNSTSLALTFPEQWLQAATAWNTPPSSTRSPLLTPQTCGNKHCHGSCMISFGKQMVQQNPSLQLPCCYRHRPPTAGPLKPPPKPKLQVSFPTLMGAQHQQHSGIKRLHQEDPLNQNKHSLHQLRIWPSTTLCAPLSITSSHPSDSRWSTDNWLKWGFSGISPHSDAAAASHQGPGACCFVKPTLQTAPATQALDLEHSGEDLIIQSQTAPQLATRLISALCTRRYLHLNTPPPKEVPVHK